MAPYCPRSRASLTSTCTSRELKKILRDLTPLEDRGRIAKLLDSAAGVDRLCRLVEDIRAAVVDYKVRPRSPRTHHT